MDILLSHGYFLNCDAAERKVMKPYPPLGLLYLSAYLEREGLDVGVYDSTFGTPAGFRRRLERCRPAAVGLYANLMTRGPVLNQIRDCQELGVKIILGGPEPAGYAREYLTAGADVVVVGEGEVTLVEVLGELLKTENAQLDGVPGICFLDDAGEVVRTPPREFIRNLDGLPLPDREAVDVPRYQQAWRDRHGYSAVSLITSRGCPYTCTWCSHGVYGYSYRNRSPAAVADEVECLKERYRPDLLWYADDVFALNRRWFFDYAAELEKRRLKMPFETISREDRLDEQVIEQLGAMGCRRLWIGAESGSQKVLDAMERRTKAARVPGLIRSLQRQGIEAGLFIMLGYEGEEIADLEQTVDFLKRANPDTYLTTVAYPIKGTPYYETVADRLHEPKPWRESSDREIEVDGRPGRRYFEFAQRWMRGEFELHQASTGRPVSLSARLKAHLNSRIGRWGMRMG